MFTVNNEILNDFNNKTKELIEIMKSMAFNLFDLRNKLNVDCNMTTSSIITQAPKANVSKTTMRAPAVQLGIYTPVQSCWWQIQAYLHKEMNLRIKTTRP